MRQLEVNICSRCSQPRGANHICNVHVYYWFGFVGMLPFTIGLWFVLDQFTDLPLIPQCVVTVIFSLITIFCLAGAIANRPKEVTVESTANEAKIAQNLSKASQAYLERETNEAKRRQVPLYEEFYISSLLANMSVENARRSAAEHAAKAGFTLEAFLTLQIEGGKYYAQAEYERLAMLRQMEQQRLEAMNEADMGTYARAKGQKLQNALDRPDLLDEIINQEKEETRKREQRQQEEEKRSRLRVVGGRNA